ncbi:Uncharacterised protein [Cronobacter sakazakii]|nr:Uncharacterised protein [Cronobacter sakazakii]STD11004.1 Uncharacterised protein [Cronobacter sakazakii]
MAVKSNRNTVIQIIRIAFNNYGYSVTRNWAGDFIAFSGNANSSEYHG